MSVKAAFTKDNLDACLSALAKEFRKLNGTATSAEIILIGGASVLVNYGFRNNTYDVDAVIHASSVMKEAANRAGDKLGLPNGWLSMDFKTTSSYSDKLAEVSVYYKTFSNVVKVRTVSAEYLIAMKLIAGRQYKNDLSDIVGIMLEHQKNGEPITQDAIDRAVNTLYGGWDKVPSLSQDFLQSMFDSGDYEAIYAEIRKSEQAARLASLDLMVKNHTEQALNRREEDRPSTLKLLREFREVKAKLDQEHQGDKPKRKSHDMEL